MRVAATYEVDHLRLTFEGRVEEYEDQNLVVDIRCIEMYLFDTFVPLDTLPEAVQAAILDLGHNEVEFELEDSSDFDDIGD